MYSSLHSNHPLDLLSYPLTYTYFSLIDQYIRFTKNSSTVSPKSLVHTLQSFLFLYDDNPRNIKKLNALAFNEFIPYTPIASSGLYKSEITEFPEGGKYYLACKYKLSFPILYKVYSKQFLRLKKLHAPAEVILLNHSFVHLHRRLIYAAFPDESSLPTLFKLTDADAFVNEVKRLVNTLK
ncbi:MAG: hypothetical protein RR090_03340 [Niameybacter sp.]|uniref:hypothetical protein n=1 Tax=Niameybacter sp. TaxID=2033640 RepID=UPI002FC823F5